MLVLVQAAEEAQQVSALCGFSCRPVAGLRRPQEMGVDELLVMLPLRQCENGLAEVQSFSQCLVASRTNHSGAIRDVAGESLFVDLSETEVALPLSLAETVHMDVSVTGGKHF